MARYEFFLASSLEKVFPEQRPAALPADSRLSVWHGTRASVQLVYRADSGFCGIPDQPFQLEVMGGPVDCKIRSVELIPSDFPCFEDADDNYIVKSPGLFPDLLSPASTQIIPLPNQYRSLWLSWDIPSDAESGDYHICISVRAVRQWTRCNGVSVTAPESDNLCFELPLTLNIGKSELPEQSLIHTEWFHADCLASHYGVEPLSEEHWQILENFISSAGQEHGINMLLTPVFTPPLDTVVGGERPTVQLVEISLDNGVYHFGYKNLSRWCSLCRKYGITYLEIAHLFTQWGALATPKIIATVDGDEQQIFGWDVPASSEEYRAFLASFIPSLRSALEHMGFDQDHVYFHISDEPSTNQMDAYRIAKAQVADLLEGCPVIDALSSFEFYQQGVVRQPIPSNDHIQAFIDAKVPDLWVYYCCAQGNLVPNRFFSMPSARNRIMGVLMYLYDIKGFLHWGYNFYYCQYSIYPVNPYEVTHAGYAFPSGDSFLVYPGKDGTPLSSLRAEVQDDALVDLRALRKLESLTDADFVRHLIYENSGMDLMTFTHYPTSSDYLLNLREKIADEINKRS